jgi:hypothetical protein
VQRSSLMILQESFSGAGRSSISEHIC